MMLIIIALITIFFLLFIAPVVATVYYNHSKKYKKFTKIPMYCIYIPKREDSIKKIFSNLNLDVNFIKGVDKNTINIRNLIKEKKIIPWGVENTGRIACHYSHLKVINEFLKSGHDRCIIFEDDLYCKYSKKYVSDILTKTFNNLPEDCDILYLGYCWENCKHMTKVNPYIFNAHKPRCRHAYSINRRTAKILLDNTSVMYHNGDEMYNRLINNGTLKAYLASVVLFEQNRGYFGSELDNNHKPIKCL
jgi:GR25 family glycosyltransferase involved in LPS biosynthesis